MSRADSKAILKARALAFAREVHVQNAQDKFVELLEFRIGSDRYAVESVLVCEVHNLRDITPIPCTPSFVLGCVNIRGQIVTILDFCLLLDLAPTRPTASSKIVIVDGPKGRVGFLSDDIVGPRRDQIEELQSSLATLAGPGAEHLRGITRDGTAFFDVMSILSDARIVIQEEVGT